MTSAAHPVLTSSDEPNWRTPSFLRAAICREFRVELDAAADLQSTLAAFWLGPESPYGIENGLLLDDWGCLVHEGCAVFCNPPYSRKLGLAIEPWVERLAITGRTRTAIGVLPFAPQTRHWRRYVTGHEFRATEVRLFPFRLKFEPPPWYENKAKDGKAHGANVNTAVVIWSPSEEYPRALPWAPLQRYWVPKEHPRARLYHSVAAIEDEGGDDE